jgi:hypothetical protein
MESTSVKDMLTLATVKEIVRLNNSVDVGLGASDADMVKVDEPVMDGDTDDVAEPTCCEGDMVLVFTDTELDEVNVGVPVGEHV